MVESWLSVPVSGLLFGSGLMPIPFGASSRGIACDLHFSWVTLLGRALRLLPDWDVLYNMERCPGLDPRDTSIPRKDGRASAPSVTIVMLGRGGCQGRPADSPEVGPW